MPPGEIQKNIHFFVMSCMKGIDKLFFVYGVSICTYTSFKFSVTLCLRIYEKAKSKRLKVLLHGLASVRQELNK